MGRFEHGAEKASIPAPPGRLLRQARTRLPKRGTGQRGALVTGSAGSGAAGFGPAPDGGGRSMSDGRVRLGP